MTKEYKRVDSGNGVQSATVQTQNLQESQPMVLVQMPGTIADVYGISRAKNTGYAHCFFGAIVILVQIAAVVVGAALTDTLVPGFWAGVVFIIAGAIGLVSANRITRYHVHAYLWLSLIAIGCSIALVLIAGFGLEMNLLSPAGHQDNRPKYGMNGALAFIGVIELIVSFTSFCVACHGICSRSTQMVGVKGHVEYDEKNNQKMLVVPDASKA